MSSQTRLRPLTVGEILDGAFSLYRRHFRRFVGAALFAQLLPVAAWTLFLFVVVPRGAEYRLLDDFVRLDYLLAGVAAVVTTGACVPLTSQAVLGEVPSLRGALGTASRRFWRLYGGSLLFGGAVLLGTLLLVIPGIVAAAVLFAYPQAMVIEGRSITGSFSRSTELARGAWLRCLGVQLVLLLAWYVPAAMIVLITVALVPGTVDGATADELSPLGYAVQGIAWSGAAALCMPLFSIGTTLLYYDRRVRVEALDLAADAPPSHPPAPPEPLPA